MPKAAGGERMTPAEFEDLTGLSGNACARLLRVQPSRWYNWRDGDRDVPPYIQASIDAHAQLFRAGLLDPFVQNGGPIRGTQP